MDAGTVPSHSRSKTPFVPKHGGPTCLGPRRCRSRYHVRHRPTPNPSVGNPSRRRNVVTPSHPGPRRSVLSWNRVRRPRRCRRGDGLGRVRRRNVSARRRHVGGVSTSGRPSMAPVRHVSSQRHGRGVLYRPSPSRTTHGRGPTVPEPRTSTGRVPFGRVFMAERQWPRPLGRYFRPVRSTPTTPVRMARRPLRPPSVRIVPPGRPYVRTVDSIAAFSSAVSGLARPGNGVSSCDAAAVTAAERYGTLRGWTVPPFQWTDVDDVVHVLALCTFLQPHRPHLPVVHVLSKALPQRCQFRSFTDICTHYCRDNAAFAAWLRKVVMASWMGVYPHCDVETALDDRIAWYVACYHAYWSWSPTTFATWVQTHGWFVFYALKEHVTVLLPLDPALAHVVHHTYHWSRFTHLVRTAMRTARTVLVQRRPGVAVELQRYHTQDVRDLVRLPARGLMTCLFAAVLASGRPRTDPYVADVVRTVARRFPQGKASTWLRLCCGCASCVSDAAVAATDHHEAARTWTDVATAFRTRRVPSAAALVPVLRRMAPHAFATFATFVVHAYQAKSIRTFPLAAHTYRAHHRLATDDGIMYVCRACRQFKGFVVRPPPHHLAASAHGHDKVLFDDTDGRVYCARRPPRLPPATQRPPPSQPSEQRWWPTRRQCCDTPLVPVALHGRALTCFGRLYVLCAHCARPCRFVFARYVHGPVAGVCCYACFALAYPPTTSIGPCPVPTCAYCGRTAPPSRRGWCAVTLTSPSPCRGWLCPRHAVPAVRAVPRPWTSTALASLIATSMDTRPPRSRRRRVAAAAADEGTTTTERPVDDV